MSHVIVEGVPPWDGRYKFDDFNLTNRELHRIKEISGVRAGELIEALEANDRAAFVGFAVVVLARHEQAVDPDDLWDGGASSIVIDLTDGPDDADPPTTEPSGSGQAPSADSSGDDS